MWGFYGRRTELEDLKQILARDRWFFARIVGRRRIGKTTLVRRALEESQRDKVFYMQTPDSAPAGVLSAVHDAMDTFELDPNEFSRPDSLLSLARLIEELVRAGFVVAVDEFQYFSRAQLAEFTSHLQAAVDRLSARTESVGGGLIVLGSLHAELVALLEDRDAPLYNRTTDQLELQHLDIGSVLALMDAHTDRDPRRLLFLWSLFEGVPKFYRDAYEQGVLGAERLQLLERMFFRSSSSLRTEADNWFLSELRGRYDAVLKYIARNPGCHHGDIVGHVKEISPTTAEHVGGYLTVLMNRYQMIERQQPIFAGKGARQGRFYVRDNFLRSWLAAIHRSSSALNFRPLDDLLERTDQRLGEVEGHSLERLVAQVYEERSRRGIGGFSLTHRVHGFWDRKGTDIDLVALDADRETIRFGTCKRNPDRLVGSLEPLRESVERFLQRHRKYRHWKQELMAIAPVITKQQRRRLHQAGAVAQDLGDLTTDL